MSAPPGGLAVFALPNVRYYVSGRFLSTMAQQIQTLGVGLYVYELTRDPLALGLAGLFTFLPQMAFFAVSGHVADSYDRRLISAIAFLVNALSAFCLFGLVDAGVATVGWFYAAIALVGLSRTFGMPASQAMIANLIDHDHRASAIAWTASATQTAIIVGPAIGGFLYLLGPKTVFLTAGALHLCAAFAMSRISPQGPPGQRREPFSLAAFTDGVAFIWRRPVLLGALSLDLVAVLFAGVAALLPIFATDILNAGPSGLGWLRTSQAIGALSMALFLARFPIRRRGGAWLLTSCAVFSGAVIAFGLSNALWLSMVCMVIEGAADMVSVVVRQTLIQNDTPDDMRGRVSSVNSLFIGASNSLGEFESGLMARLFGVVPATLLGGALGLGAAALWTAMFPALRRRDKL